VATRNPAEAEQIVLDAQHPWPSLHAFTRDHSTHFRGRDSEIEELVGCLRRRVLTVLFGLSGLGKTSLLQAGVFAALGRTEFVPILIRLDPEAKDIDLVEQIREQICLTIKGEDVRVARGPEADEDLWSFFHRPDLDWFSPLGTRLNAVLVFDQFEEIFTRSHRDNASIEEMAESAANRRHLLRELAALIENRPPDEVKDQIEEDPKLVSRYDFSQQDYRVVISLREDYLPQLEELKKRIPSIMENRFRLTRMNEHQALQAILEPGRDVIKEPVAREVVAFITGSSDLGTRRAKLREIDPALLSLMCSELNNQRLQDHLPLITSELLKGRSDRILDEFYRRCFEFIPEDKRLAARILVEERLLTGDKHRETLAVETVEKEIKDKGLPSDTLERLVDKRLLQFDERHGLQRVELAHDILTKVVGEHRDKRKAMEEAGKLRRRELEERENQRRLEQQERDAAKQREEVATAEIRELRKARNRYIALGLVFAMMLAFVSWLLLKQQQLTYERDTTKDKLAKTSTLADRAVTLESAMKGLESQSKKEQTTLKKAVDLLRRLKQEGVVQPNSESDRQIRELVGGNNIPDIPSNANVIERRNKSRELDRVGDQARDDKKWKAALDAYTESKTIRESLAEKDKDPELRFDVSSSHNNIGNVYFDQGDFDKALTEFQEALKIRDDLARDSTDTRWQRGRFFSLLNIADALQKAPGRTNEAIQSAQKAEAIANTLAKSQPDNPTWKKDRKLAADQISRLQSETRQQPKG
jgi:tetratricopeptide (TPR) repeat protein